MSSSTGPGRPDAVDGAARAGAAARTGATGRAGTGAAALDAEEAAAGSA
jgi:hypothetical protein